jgi:MarR family transcriptional regulator, lower aerobic nicotinate degradation pathway regulator
MDDRDAPSRVRSQPSWLLARAASRASRLVADRTAELGATRATFSLLAALEEFGPASQAALGRRLGLDRKDVSSLVRVLGADGFVERAVDPADSRRQRVEITDDGMRMLDRLEEAISLAQDDLLGALPTRDRVELARILAALGD